MMKIVLECIIVPFIFVDKFQQKLPVHPLICPSISYGRKKFKTKVIAVLAVWFWSFIHGIMMQI